MNDTQQTFEDKAAEALTRQPAKETTKQKSREATAALTEVVNEGESPNLDAMPRVGTLEVWQSFEQKFNKLKITAETIKITDGSQLAEMKIARTVRLELKGLRVEIEHKAKELGEEALRRKQKIDADKRFLVRLIEPLETLLLEQENFIERQEEARKQALRDERAATLKEYGSDGTGFQLGDMAQEAFDALVNSLRQLRDDKIKASKEAEEQRIAKEKADAEERERVRLENERLKAEAAEKEAALKAEREIARKEQDRLEALAQAERDKAAKEREEAARLAREEADRVKAEREAEAKKAAAERKAERDKFEADQKKEREARQKAEKELAEKRRLEAEESSRQREEAERAKRAPDKEKILALARYIREIALPMVMSDEAGAIIAKIESQAEKFAAWIEKEAATL